MHRRAYLGGVAMAVTGLSGCGGGESEPPVAGEIDVTFETRASQSYMLRLELVDANGDVVDELESEFPPDQDDAPSFFASGLTDGPYTVTISTDADTQTLEWSPEDCRRFELRVILLADGLLEYSGRCSTAES
ncbi:hypothetical protein ACFQJ5_14605 [Halomicroarcula sp. GCM10025324]|uniref:hypothetical protein n=1 Tax=Haloarcula TaxID=2237 RepID=UPI0023E794BE|nr:hypothetical protein [Halomicroarcula sp. ZS-22-S1]